MAKGKYEKWLTEEGLILLQGWAREGLTNEDISKKMGISAKTLYEWKNKYSEICEALKKGKEVADFEIENALYKRAKGFKIIEQKLDKFGDVVELEREIPPDPSAIIFWLKNRKPDKWKDRVEKVSVNDKDRIVNINIIGTGENRKDSGGCRPFLPEGKNSEKENGHKHTDK